MNSNETQTDQVQPDDVDASARRDFIKKVSKASAAAPAVALLLAANFKSANAESTYTGGSGSS